MQCDCILPYIKLKDADTMSSIIKTPSSMLLVIFYVDNQTFVDNQV